MEQDVQSRVLNLGCGFRHFIGAVNVDAYDNCKPDVVWDLNKTPWEWAKDNEYDAIFAWHVFEHLSNWFGALKECSRILKPGGKIEIRVPDESSSTAGTYRDHVFVFTQYSFHGIEDGNSMLSSRGGTNAWAVHEQHQIPLKCIHYWQVPYKGYNWMLHCTWLLKFCARHLRNFIWEQIFIFEKIGEQDGQGS